jgi:hypothetical protein
VVQKPKIGKRAKSEEKKIQEEIEVGDIDICYARMT